MSSISFSYYQAFSISFSYFQTLVLVSRARISARIAKFKGQAKNIKLFVSRTFMVLSLFLC